MARLVGTCSDREVGSSLGAEMLHGAQAAGNLAGA